MNTTIKNIRLASQQLSKQAHRSPGELVAWMGAMQAQEFNMAKWAVGIRLPSCTEAEVEDAFNRGAFFRTHVMRPTWHFVAAEDIRWLVQLTGNRVKSAIKSLAKELHIAEKEYGRAHKVLEKTLRDDNHLTKEEIAEVFARSGLSTATPWHVKYYLMSAEADGVVCSGTLKGKKQTYAMLEERAPADGTIHKEEALAKLAKKYLQSHSPATLQDFIWWSGLTISDARHAFGLIENELIKDCFDSAELYIHEAYKEPASLDGDVCHYLPAYDEYIISYKNRTNVLDPEHHPKAFNNYGIFQPLLLHNGHAVGNWKKNKKANEIDVAISLWESDLKMDKKPVALAGEKFRHYINGNKK